MKKRLLKRKILSMKDLPSLSSHVRNLMLMLRDPEADIDQIVEEINRDQALVAQILRLVNSGYYSLPNQIDTVEQAVSLVGFSKVWDLLMSTSVMTLMTGREKLLWAHSYSTSLLMREIIEQEKVRCSPKLPLTMLMHDIGKLVLMTFNVTTYKLVEQISLENMEPQFIVEDKRLGVNHAEAGSWLLESWELEREHIQQIDSHHASRLPEEYRVEVALMQIVDYCDSIARNRPCAPPLQLLINEAKLEHIQVAQWCQRQRQIVAEVNQQEGIR